MNSFVHVNPDSHFPIQNIPFGVFSSPANKKKRVGVAIGDMILDLSIIEKQGFFNEIEGLKKNVFNQASLNKFMSHNLDVCKNVRKQIQHLLDKKTPDIKDNIPLKVACLLPLEYCNMHLPVEIGDYTDFYSSREHATNVGTMFRGKDNALNPNWLHLPVAYHGRASSIIPSEQSIKRPKGQINPNNKDPEFGASQKMDFELEMGFFVGQGNKLGTSISIDNAHKHIFGMVLVNDWSARDIQKWEYVPLGPFLGKNFATSISPWVVTMDALHPFKVSGPKQNNPKPLKYLQCNEKSAYDINLEVSIKSKKMDYFHTICKSNFKYLYWNVLQQLTHHTINGCNTQTGDLLASGTISGPTKDSFGSLLELSWGGTKPISINEDEARTYIEDGDTISMAGYCQGKGYRVGFGNVINLLDS